MPEQVLDDVLDGYVSLQMAQKEYGVVITPDNLKIDKNATLALRSQKLG